jgi:xanthine dehydrogenase/oxidase
MHYPVIIAVTHIPELNEITKIENGIKFGSSVTLTDIDHEFNFLSVHTW